MGFLIRKSIKLLPGIRLNLATSGVSASIGQPGAAINIAERGARSTVGIPGTGLSYSERLSGPNTVPVQTRGPTSSEHAPTQEATSSGKSFAPMLLLVLVVLLAGVLIFRLVAP